MTVLILGVALWWGAHLFKRLAPARRAGMGDKGKGLVTVLVLASVVLMVLGYRAAEFVPVWEPPGFLVHVNNLLMLLALYLYAASGMKTAITRVIRHPQLTAVKTWAVAHLLVNGDLASIILFGGLLAWAVVAVIVINRSEPAWVRPAPAPAKKEVMAVVGTIVVVVIVMLIHNWLGVPPWG
ncbi:NnrU family protein [Tabrizicola sp. BL-A-41-H6]|uniref:NnrU family protein n=1 Tax=Tabrizicola sp. BL-A-41-H6 TaxID=3421107 RepID=UPI003D67A126